MSGTYSTRFALALGLVVAMRAGAQPAPANVAPRAWDAAAGGTAEILIVLRDRADLSAAATLERRDDKAWFVALALRATAERSQKELRAWLAARHVAFRPFYIVDCIWARADRATIAAVAGRPEVERVEWNPWVKGLLERPQQLVRNPAAERGPVPLAVEWNVDLIGAPLVWAQGWRGEGIVVGGQDTGVRWTHELIKERYRGWDAATGTASHDYNWHDAIHAPASGGRCGPDSPEPCDDHGHGTHTIGTVLGSDAAGDETGVAPAAQWIGCRDMDQGNGSPATYLECFEFFLAPYPIGSDPTTGDPSKAPDLTTNSWACPPSEGCAWDILQEAVIAQRAAGILTVVAAGNSGPACGSVNNPPAVYDAAFTVGATDSSDAMAGFSSRGPTGPEGLQKPDICAPGVSVRSGLADADDVFASWSGTSMATPHVAGAVALLWSARPLYAHDADRTEELLERTALRLPGIVESCGGDYVSGPNGTWGYGRIDIAAAVAAACMPPGEANCGDGIDSDCDGLADCADPDCIGSVDCPEARYCVDGMDNDGDALVDCADPDCNGDPACPEPGRCLDGLDNDLDGLVDCEDSDCDGDAACPESAACADSRDNDADGLVDCADPDCNGSAACPEPGRCADLLDNDLDGLLDCDDPDCDGDAGCPEAARCGDGRDNDVDGLTDCVDLDCVGSIECPEQGRCADGIDEDGDGFTDCSDVDCAGDPGCPEASWCADGIDQDLDGLADCLDADCVADSYCASDDYDGDGRPNATDCMPLDPSVFDAAPEVARLAVLKVPGGCLVAWVDAAPACGSGVRYDVAAGRLADFRAAGLAAPACAAQGLASRGWFLPFPDPRNAFLVRAVTPCGPGPTQGWGRDSLGRDRPACP